MMTTSKVFGINRPGDHIAQSQAIAQNADTEIKNEQQRIESEKFKLLQEALTKFLNKEITKAELEVIQTSLK